MAFRKHELVVVCRAKGWKGSESRLPAEYFTKWLDDRSVPESERAEIIKRFRTGQVGGNGEQRNSPSIGVTQAEVIRLIENALPAATAAVDKEELRAMIAEQVAKANPAKIVVKENEPKAAPVKIEGAHPLFEKVLKLVAAGQAVLLKGPAGCGKSYLAAQIAKAMKLNYGALHCSAGASEAQLLGWLLPTGKGGQFEYEPAQFAKMYKEGHALFLMDEIDAADPNMLMVLNGALANGHLHVPQNLKEPSVARGKNFCVMAAANTYGTGADAMYVGRNQLDAATLDRFYVVEMDYDRNVESSMAPKEVCEWVWNLRDRARAAKLRRVISTRTIQRMAAGLKAGLSMQEVQADAVLGWTADEKAKVGL